MEGTHFIVHFFCAADGLLSYTSEDGELKGRDDGLQDLTYDGHKDGNKLYGGLGQLTDGEIGHTNYRVDSTGKSDGK